MKLKLPKLQTDSYIIYCPITKEVFFETDNQLELLEETLKIVSNTIQSAPYGHHAEKHENNQTNLLKAWFKAQGETEKENRSITLLIKTALNEGLLELGEIKSVKETT